MLRNPLRSDSAKGTNDVTGKSEWGERFREIGYSIDCVREVLTRRVGR